MFQPGHSQDCEAGGREFGGCHHNETVGGFLVCCGDTQDVAAFPRACAHVSLCVGSLWLAKKAWLCLVSS